MANFELAARKILKHEGGFQKSPNDPGNFTSSGKLVGTNKGISAQVYERFLGREPSERDMRNLTDREADQIYKKQYWDRIWGDRFQDQSLAEIVFDYAVNSGVGRAVQLLQYIYNNYFAGTRRKLAVDGGMGPNTFGAITSVNPAQLFNVYKKYRTWYYQHLVPGRSGENHGYGPVPQDASSFFTNVLRARSNQKLSKFFNGWINRINSFEGK